MKFKHTITVTMTDDLLQEIKHALAFKHRFGGGLFDECDFTLLAMVNAIEDNKSTSIYLRSMKEAREREGK